MHEKCAVFGVYDPGHEAARTTHTALMTLQHRGQESSGIAVSNHELLSVHKGMGLVAHVYNEEQIAGLVGDIAIGHNRYSTSQGSTIEHVQPVMHEGVIAFAHNGNLPSTTALEIFLDERESAVAGRNDSELMADALSHFLAKGMSVPDAMREVYPLFTGAFSAVFLTKDQLCAVRDPKGIRPLSLGALNGGYVVASETCAFDTIGATFIRDVEPGELVIINKNGVTSHRLAQGEQKLDIFELIYFSRPDSMLLGERVNDVRYRFGQELAREHPVDADVIIPIPDSAIPAAEGYAHDTGIPMRQGFAKNRYIHRTFIQPDQRLRSRGVAMKLNPMPDVIAGKSVVIIDDSIVRGTTARELVHRVREAGAKRVFFLVSSPPILYPDFYGIDTPRQKDLIAARMSIEEIRDYIGADDLYFLSYDGMVEATHLPESLFHMACFTGEYPIDIGSNANEVDKVIYPVSSNRGQSPLYMTQ